VPRITGQGPNGRAIADFPAATNSDFPTPSFDTAQSLALAPDGKIVLGGVTIPNPFGPIGTGDDFAVDRFNPDGSLDGSFGSGGLVGADLGRGQKGSLDQGYSVLIQPDGQVVVGRIASVSTGPYGRLFYFALARYDPHGQLDPSFGSGGTDIIQTTGVDIDLNSVVTMALRSDGKIVVAGSAFGAYAQLYGITDDLAIVRVTRWGVLDPPFGNGGVEKTDLTPSGAVSLNDDHAAGVVIQPDGKIIVGGWTQNLGSSVPGSVCMAPTPVLLRYEPDGSLDLSLGSGGIAITARRARPASD
jgi:uncharacterized delta-60 repeat protein